VAQRLTRRLCTCKQPTEIPRDALLAAGFTDADLDGSWQPFKPVGCDRCKGSGYKGRVGIYEVMPITPPMQELILANAGSTQLARQARAEGVNSLRRSGLLKVKEGMTSLEEVLGCTNE
jgi:type IV pilus assembly protein PilB